MTWLRSPRIDGSPSPLKISVVSGQSHTFLEVTLAPPRLPYGQILLRGSELKRHPVGQGLLLWGQHRCTVFDCGWHVCIGGGHRQQHPPGGPLEGVGDASSLPAGKRFLKSVGRHRRRLVMASIGGPLLVIAGVAVFLLRSGGSQTITGTLYPKPPLEKAATDSGPNRRSFLPGRQNEERISG